MRILDRIDEQLTTETINGIGKATVQAFGSSYDLARMGAQETVSYVQIQATCCFAACIVFCLTLCAIGIGFWKKQDPESWSCEKGTIAVIFWAFSALLFALSMTNVPTMIKPAGRIIHDIAIPRNQ